MAPSSFRVGIAQVDSALGDLAHNLDLTARSVRQAKGRAVDLLVFPELALSGYGVRQRFHEVALPLDGPEIDKLKELSREVALVTGFVEETPDARFFNSAIFLAGGEILHVHRKVYPPTYGIFDERRYFGAGRDISAFDAPFGRMAMLICGDCWHLSLPYLAARDGADILIVLAASSDHSLSEQISGREAWERLNRTYALTLSCFVVFANRAGSEGDLQFWGGSHIVQPNGQILVQGKLKEPDLVVGDLDLSLVRKQRIILPFRRDDNLNLVVDVARKILKDNDRHGG